jgi:uncharacterized DUF497 family protein
MDFRWNDWNLEHVAEHGIDPEEAEAVLEAAGSPWPRYRGDGKWLVWGPGRGGRPVQVVFVLDPDDTIFILHARPLTEREKRRFRRQGR